jgi:hypothetical protein
MPRITTQVPLLVAVGVGVGTGAGVGEGAGEAEGAGAVVLGGALGDELDEAEGLGLGDGAREDVGLALGSEVGFPRPRPPPLAGALLPAERLPPGARAPAEGGEAPGRDPPADWL